MINLITDAVRARGTAARFTKDTPPARFMWMPAATHTIAAAFTGVVRGKRYVDFPHLRTIEVEPSAVDRLNAAYADLRASRQTPLFGCFDHNRTIASMHPADANPFSWDDGTTGNEPGIYIAGTWTAAGTGAVRAGNYCGWSPSFGCDVDLSQLLEHDGALLFPPGARGALNNPCRVLYPHEDVGTLTNNPAFAAMQPVNLEAVRAHHTSLSTGSSPVEEKKTSGSPPHTQKEIHMDPVATPAVDTATLDTVRAENKVLKESATKLQKQVLDAAMSRAAGRQAFAPARKDAIRAKAEKLAAVDLETAVEYLDELVGAPADALRARQTEGPEQRLEVGHPGLRDAFAGIVKARKPQNDLVRATRMDEAFAQSSLVRTIWNTDIAPALAKGADLRLQDIVRAGTTDVTDVDAGTLGGLVMIMRDLGFLENELAILDDITVDFSNEPIKFGNWAASRYFTTSTPAKWNGTAWVPNTPNALTATDVKIKMDQFFRVWHSAHTSLIGSTVRNLLLEQKAPGLQGLAEAIFTFLIGVMLNGKADDTGTVIKFAGLPAGAPGRTADKTFLKAIGDFKGSVTPGDLAAGLDLQKVPDMDGWRWALLHSLAYRALGQDIAFINAEALANATQGLNRDVLGTGRLPAINNIQFRKSQLMLDGATLADSSGIGFCGARNSLVFCGRVPADWTKLFGNEVPSTAAVEIVQSPKIGFPLLYVRYTDNPNESANAKSFAMCGAAVGQKNAGFVITQK